MIQPIQGCKSETDCGSLVSEEREMHIQILRGFRLHRTYIVHDEGEELLYTHDKDVFMEKLTRLGRNKQDVLDEINAAEEYWAAPNIV